MAHTISLTRTPGQPLGLKTDGKGVLMSPVPNTPAACAGVKEGDRITRVNGKVVIDMMKRTPLELVKEVIKRDPNARSFTLEVVRPVASSSARPPAVAPSPARPPAVLAPSPRPVSHARPSPLDGSRLPGPVPSLSLRAAPQKMPESPLSASPTPVKRPRDGEADDASRERKAAKPPADEVGTLRAELSRAKAAAAAAAEHVAALRAQLRQALGGGSSGSAATGAAAAVASAAREAIGEMFDARHGDECGLGASYDDVAAAVAAKAGCGGMRECELRLLLAEMHAANQVCLLADTYHRI